MPIKNKDGSSYALKGPNALVSKFGYSWQSNEITYFNFHNYAISTNLGELKSSKIITKIQPENKNIKEVQEDRTERINRILDAPVSEVDDYLNNDSETISEDDMPVLKTDGTLYELGGRDSLKSYRPGGQDQVLLDSWDQEQIELAGSPIIYYPCFIDSDHDDLYMESVDSIIAQEGYRVYAQFDPIRPAQDLGPFGIDSPDEMLFNLNISQWKDTVGPMPKVKSIIYCEWDKTWWEIIQNEQGDPYKLWTKFRLTIVAKKYQGSRVDKHPSRRDALKPDGSSDQTLNIF